MARDIRGVLLKGVYCGFYEVVGKDGNKYNYAQFMQKGNGRSSLVDVRVRDLDVLNGYTEGNEVELKVDIRELLSKEGRPFVVVDAA